MTKNGALATDDVRERRAFLPIHNFNAASLPLEENLRDRLPAGLMELGIGTVILDEVKFTQDLLRRVKYVIMLDRKPSSGQVCKYPKLTQINLNKPK
eukprot:9232936-Pyramimonas_sp.AAC.1